MADSTLLSGKVAMVTGASRGIGKSVVYALVEHGARGVVMHVNATPECIQEAEQMLRDLKDKLAVVRIVQGDISLRSTAESIVSKASEAFGRIDILVSSAGICPFHSFLDMPDDLWKRTQEVNLDGTYYVVKAVANEMAYQNNPPGGSIVAISSISALVGGGMQTHYTPTKAGIKSLMESCAISLGPHNIRCNSILPGTIATDINKDDLGVVEKRTALEKRTCLGRLGTPDDIAGPVVFLASDLSKYVTGSSLLVDGGMFVNLQ